MVRMKGKMVGILLDHKSCWGQRILGIGVLERATTVRAFKTNLLCVGI